MSRTMNVRKHSLYDIWYQMNKRCADPNDRGFHNYGGRGIQVCREWTTQKGNYYGKGQPHFWNFVHWVEENLGERPTTGNAGHSLDRIDNDGNYEPGNLRWATKKEQRDNQRTGLHRSSADCNQKLGKSGVRGCYKTKTGKWTAQVYYYKKAYNLGTFDTLEEASAAYEAKRCELRG